MEFKLLVVDDDRELVEGLAEFLVERGYRVIQAASGDEALAVLGREPVDLVVLDLQMPGLSGLDVLKRLRANHPETKAVVLTAHAEMEKEARSVGCDEFLTKPFTLGQLTFLVQGLLSEKDEEELKELAMGLQFSAGDPGQPWAQILLLEPRLILSYPLERFLEDPEESGGVYKVHVADTLDKALMILQAMHPDLVILDLLAIEHPAEAVKQLLACEVQPKDYIFFMRPRSPDQERALADVAAKRWDGDPLKEEGLQALAELLRQTAREHGLLKR